MYDPLMAILLVLVDDPTSDWMGLRQSHPILRDATRASDEDQQ